MATVVVVDTHGVVVAAVPEPAKAVEEAMQVLNVPVMVGCGFTVTVAVMPQPLLFTYVITLVPAATPVTTPVLLTVATVVVAEVHGLVVAAVPDPINVVVEAIQTFKVPVIVGSAFIVTVAVCLQPLLLV